MHSGCFIALEGIDGAGTTTQAQRLASAVQACGREAITTHEPSDGPLGRALREALSSATPPPPHSMALGFSADRFEHEARIIAPALARGAWVFCDRYLLSTLAYQGIKLPVAWLATLNEAARRPDVTLLLDIDPDVAAERRRARGGKAELYDALATQRLVADNYRKLAQDAAHAGKVSIVDAAPPVAEVTQALIAKLRALSLWP